MNRYVVRDLMGYGDDFRLLKILVGYGNDFRLLKIREFLAYFRTNKLGRFFGFEESTRRLGYFTPNYYNNYYTLESACLSGNEEIVNLAISLAPYPDWNEGLHGACQGGHRKIVELMIQKGADRWNDGFRLACVAGHLDVAKLMIEKGATNFETGLYRACAGGHLNLVKLIYPKALEHYERSDLESSFSVACGEGHREVIDFLMSRGLYNWRLGLFEACRWQKQDMVELMIEKGASYCMNCRKTIEEHLE